MTARKSEISLLNILMCLAVVFVHILSWTIGNVDKSSVQYIFVLVPWRLLQFVVQGFIFLSAVKLFSSKKEANYESFLAGRYKRVVLPYVIWVLVYYVYFIKYFGYTFSFDKLGEYLFFGTICSHFYFVVIIMQFYLNMPLFKWLTKKVNLIALCVGSVIFTALFKQYVHFQYDDRVFPAYLCYFAIGAAVGLHYEKAKEFIKRRFYLAAVPFVLFAFFDALCTYRAQVFGDTFKYIEIVHLFYCIFATLFFFGLFVLLSNGKKIPKFLALLDRSSYSIYLSHVLFIYIANDLAARLNIVGITENLVFRAVFTYVLTLGLCMAVAAITEKIKNGKQTSRTVSKSA
ncbi:MAG: acyltransferase [Clostridia bacterium]|nr:acyltransferase [Clostridia bacterium]